MLNKVISTLQNLKEVKYNKINAEQTIAEATEMFNAGWDNLKDGIVIITKGNLVAVKKGNTIVKYEMQKNHFTVTMGRLSGDIAKEIGVIEVAEDKKESYLAQAIVTKYYTIARA